MLYKNGNKLYYSHILRTPGQCTIIFRIIVRKRNLRLAPPEIYGVLN
jgi:hypothetical protein